MIEFKACKRAKKNDMKKLCLKTERNVSGNFFVTFWPTNFCNAAYWKNEALVLLYKHATFVVNIDFHRFFSRISHVGTDDTEAVELCTATLTKTLKDRFHGGGASKRVGRGEDDPKGAKKNNPQRAEYRYGCFLKWWQGPGPSRGDDALVI